MFLLTLDIEIRKATVDDVKVITELRIELLESVGDVDDKNRLEIFNSNLKYFKEKITNGDFTAWVADLKGKVVAISGLVLFERPPHGENISGKEAYIMNMYTKTRL